MVLAVMGKKFGVPVVASLLLNKLSRPYTITSTLCVFPALPRYQPDVYTRTPMHLRLGPREGENEFVTLAPGERLEFVRRTTSLASASPIVSRCSIV